MTRPTCILGIDPGMTGAIAFWDPADPEIVAAFDMPVVAKSLDEAALARRIAQFRPALAVIEQVSSMPKQGVASTFKFGTTYGAARGIVAALGIPVHFVVPTKWKRHFGLSSDKELSRARAIHLWPASSLFEAKGKGSGRAEAALLARYGAEVVLGSVTAKAAGGLAERDGASRLVPSSILSPRGAGVPA